jgi:hypothetical protein
MSEMDFFSVPTATFRVLYSVFVISHARRRALHFSTTHDLTSEWILKQIREAHPQAPPPRYLIRDRDCNYEGKATDVLNRLGDKLMRTAGSGLHLRRCSFGTGGVQGSCLHAAIASS